MNKEHTPLPWRSGDCFHTIFGPKKADGGMPEIVAVLEDKHIHASNKTKANMQLIIRAVNNHDKLLKALKDLACQVVLEAEREGEMVASKKYPALHCVRIAIAEAGKVK